jgi:hypothetical protein
MLRGSQKRMIVVRTRDSRLFEEAYFVIRRSADEHSGDADDEWDMLREANRILESSMAGVRRESFPAAASPRPRKGQLRGLLWFLCGLITGGGAASLLWFLL